MERHFTVTVSYCYRGFEMRLWLAVLVVFLSSTPGWGQDEFSRIPDSRDRADALATARQELAGRTDDAAMARWSSVLDQMHLAGDSDLKKVVQDLRAMNLYQSERWIYVVNTGYAYLGDSEGSRQFNAEVARRTPDSATAIHVLIEQWDAAHPMQDPSKAGMLRWQRTRLAFLERLHEQRPHSRAASQEYLNYALLVEGDLSAVEAVRVADLALRSKVPFLFDLQFQIAELYLHHHVRLDRVPVLLAQAVQHASTDVESPQRTKAKLRADCDLAEYWLARNNEAQAQAFARQARSDLLLLASHTNGSSQDTDFLGAEQERWMELARRLGMDAEPILSEKRIDWSQVPREPLDAFSVVDLAGRQWTLQDLRGKVVLVTTWATWCGPCRAELASLQKLNDALQGRNDRLILTINIDSSEDLARRFLRQQHYTFPVIRSVPLATLINADVGAPQNRFVNANGEVLVQPIEFSSRGFVSTIEQWMDELK